MRDVEAQGTRGSCQSKPVFLCLCWNTAKIVSHHKQIHGTLRVSYSRAIVTLVENAHFSVWEVLVHYNGHINT